MALQYTSQGSMNLSGSDSWPPCASNSSQASCGLFLSLRFFCFSIVHVILFRTRLGDASAHTPHGTSMVIDGHKALRPPDKEIGCDADGCTVCNQRVSLCQCVCVYYCSTYHKAVRVGGVG